jgi:hypothetical protein
MDAEFFAGSEQDGAPICRDNPDLVQRPQISQDDAVILRCNNLLPIWK